MLDADWWLRSDVVADSRPQARPVYGGVGDRWREALVVERQVLRVLHRDGGH